MLNIINICDKQKKIYQKYLTDSPARLNLLDRWKQRYENSHSEVIATLLNPKGEHKHGDVFLKLFINEFLKDDDGNTIVNCEDLSKVFVKTEYGANEQRRIDIFIKIDDKTCIIIENKIDAHDQKNQLHDYIMHVKKTYTNIHTIYLTKYGVEASKESLGELDEEEREKIFCKSYREDVSQWLHQCLKNIDKNNDKDNVELVKSALIQYRDTIMGITKTREGVEKMKTDMAKIILEQFNDYSKIDDQVEQIRALRDAAQIVVLILKAIKVLDEYMLEYQNAKIYYGSIKSPQSLINREELLLKISDPDSLEPFYLKIPLDNGKELSVAFTPKNSIKIKKKEQYFAHVGFLKTSQDGGTIWDEKRKQFIFEKDTYADVKEEIDTVIKRESLK